MFLGAFSPIGALLGSWNYGWQNGSEKVLGDRSLVVTRIPNANFLILNVGYYTGLVRWARSHPSAYDPGSHNDVPMSMIKLGWGGYAVAGYTNVILSV